MGEIDFTLIGDAPDKDKWNQCCLKLLLGKTVMSVRVDAGKDTIAFDTDDGVIGYLCAGDCCSQSWIEHLNGVKNILGKRVIGFRDRGMVSSFSAEDDPENPFEDELIQVYGYDLRTDEGIFEIEMRNSSNGYYGGNLKAIGWDWWDERVTSTDIAKECAVCTLDVKEDF